MEKLIEITRSFSYKLNTGKYETRDFFCSQKAECKPSEAEEVSEKLYQFCKTEVIKSLNDWKEVNPTNTNKTVTDPETEYSELPLVKKEFVKPWEKQMSKTMEDIHDKFGETAKKQPYNWNDPIYQATDREGGKILVNKEANTTEPK